MISIKVGRANVDIDEFTHRIMNIEVINEVFGTKLDPSNTYHLEDLITDEYPLLSESVKRALDDITPKEKPIVESHEEKSKSNSNSRIPGSFIDAVLLETQRRRRNNTIFMVIILIVVIVLILFIIFNNEDNSMDEINEYNYII